MSDDAPAQVGRFLLKLIVPYPSREDETAIIDRMAISTPRPGLEPVLHPDELIEGTLARLPVP
ncbi:MAG: hypothetical protein J7M08_03885 [Planctomycetes bacterium]|nr:hypothetical protein [Planctomycetota bacterium]